MPTGGGTSDDNDDDVGGGDFRVCAPEILYAIRTLLVSDDNDFVAGNVYNSHYV